MSRTMYDSITAADIPAGAQVVAGYVNGTYRWSDADWGRFPNAVQVRIATQAYVNDGHVLDVEQGDATPAQAPGWVKMRRAAGVDPTVYCSASALATVQAAFTAAGVAQPHYWIAHYDNVPSLPSGCVAKQYIDPPTSGGHYDLSVVADYWPGVDSAPNGNGGQPAPSTTGVEIMERQTITPPNNETQTLRVFLSGSPGAAVVFRPRLNKDGYADNPIWVPNIYAWNSDHNGIGFNPATDGYKTIPMKMTSHRRYVLPNAVWADLEYSCAGPFELDIVG